MTEIKFSVPQNDRTTMAGTSNLPFLQGHPIVTAIMFILLYNILEIL